MKVFKDENPASNNVQEMVSAGSAVTIGNFDGIHLGHRAILRRLKECSAELGVPSVMLTFDPHPRKVLSSPASLRLLTDTGDKCRLIEKFGIDIFLTIKFDRKFAALSPSEFIENWIMPLNPGAVIVGYDFNFGRGGSGSMDLLREIGGRRGFHVEMVDKTSVEGVTVSSSRIRNLVEGGEVALAEKLLGRPYSVSGPVVRGHGRGRKLGFPTANIATRAEILPDDGVYAGQVVMDGKPLPAMINIGSNPTFNDIARSLEACILDFDDDLYGMDLEVRFLERVRNEVKFSGPEKLAEQITRDQVFIEEFFVERSKRQGA